MSLSPVVTESWLHISHDGAVTADGAVATNLSLTGMSTQNLSKHIHRIVGFNPGGLMIVRYEVRVTGASRLDTGSIGRRNGSWWHSCIRWCARGGQDRSVLDTCGNVYIDHTHRQNKNEGTFNFVLFTFH